MRTADGEARARLEIALGCAAIEPGLHTVLLFDAEADAFAQASDRLADYIAAATGLRVVQVRLDTSLREDDLWRRPVLVPGDAGVRLEYRAGPLAATATEDAVPLVIVPDLVRLDLPAARGLLTVLEGEVVHLERHGESRAWRPQAWWLAGCERAAAGRISPHLLDRFALRLEGGVLRTAERDTAALRERLGEDRETRSVSVAPRLSEAEIRRAASETPRLADSGLARVHEYFPATSITSPRREFALARLAIAYARLFRSRHVGSEAVDRAAALLGLSPTSEEMARPAAQPAAPVPVPDTSAAPGAFPEGVDLVAADGSGGPRQGDGSDLVASPGEAAAVGDAVLGEAPTDPYPEDQALPAHDFSPLSAHAVRVRGRSALRGTIIGVERTRTAHDLAILSTILTAAKWQPYRRAQGGGERLRLHLSDLRRYRRAPASDRILVLVIDFTCLDGINWGSLVFPSFRWAYVERAEVCLVRVGADDARLETRADRVLARNLLDPRLDQALAAGGGNATPLAHGLQLALDTLRHKLQHGQGVVREARLVVLTDGRGNVPLLLDPDLRVSNEVRALGIDDAIAVAQAIRALPNVEALLVDPEPQLHRHVFEQLAAKMGARVIRQAEPVEAAA